MNRGPRGEEGLLFAHAPCRRRLPQGCAACIRRKTDDARVSLRPPDQPCWEMLSRASMMMTSLETLKNSFALYIKLFGESVSMDIGTEGLATRTYMYKCAQRRYCLLKHK